MTLGVLLAQEGGAEGLGGLLLPLGFLVILYFLLIRPQSKRRRELARLIASVKVGDLVATLGGLHGAVVDLDADIVELAVTEDVEGKPDVVLRFDRNAIARIIESADAPDTDA